MAEVLFYNYDSIKKNDCSLYGESQIAYLSTGLLYGQMIGHYDAFFPVVPPKALIYPLITSAPYPSLPPIEYLLNTWGVNPYASKNSSITFSDINVEKKYLICYRLQSDYQAEDLTPTASPPTLPTAYLRGIILDFVF